MTPIFLVAAGLMSLGGPPPVAHRRPKVPAIIQRMDAQFEAGLVMSVAGYKEIIAICKTRPQLAPELAQAEAGLVRAEASLAEMRAMIAEYRDPTPAPVNPAKK